MGADQRPLGPARFEFVTGEDFYTAVLEGRIKALVSFGGNMVMAHADSLRGREALRSQDFFVHADLFMTPTAELADIVLPVTSPFESEALKIGFEYSQEAQSLVQLRQPLVAPRGEARSVSRSSSTSRRGSASARTSGTATSKRRSAINSHRAQSPWKTCRPTPRECGCR